MTNPTPIVLKPVIPLVPVLPTDPVVSMNDTIQSGSPGFKVTMMILGVFAVVVLAIILFVFKFKT